jgi:hypothetical protein
MPFDRRLQLLIDEERYQRVAARARERGLSVGAVIREAIDVAVPDLARKRAAASAILAAEPIPVPETVEELKAELDAMHHPEL